MGVIDRIPFAAGDRTPSGPPTQVANISVYRSGTHWPKTLDMADDGTVYVGNGGDEEACPAPQPFQGGILKIDAANPAGVQVARGFRNPINVRCWHGHGTCFALELAKDFSGSEGGREKMVPIRSGDDWGFPCCATQNLPYGGAGTADCSGVVAENNSFLIGSTPFGLDFEPGVWPAPFTANAFVVTHGAVGSWSGARIVAIPMDPSTGLPMPSSSMGGTNVGMTDFAVGWDDGSFGHGRPAAITFAPDGRLYVANDMGASQGPGYDGLIFWIAPLPQ
jgi:glucose/arabinose dehydrogenase